MDKEKLNQLADFLLTTLQQTKDFAIEQAPLVVQETLAYDAWEMFFGIKVVLVILLVTFVLFLIALKVDKDNDGFSFTSFVFLVVAILVNLVIIPCNYSKLKKIEMAPRAYLLEKLQGRK